MRAFQMTKQELYTALQTSGQLNRMTSSELWKEAFKRYNTERGTKLKPNCGRCFETVTKWLQS